MTITLCGDSHCFGRLNGVGLLSSSINIMQVRIARGRLAGDPPDVTVEPRLAHFRLLDFHRGKEAIEEGRLAVERAGNALGVSKQQAS